MNPVSSTQSTKVLRKTLPKLIALKPIRLFAQFTQYPGHAEEMVRGLTRDDYDVILVAGGDGTVGEVINGLLGPVADSRVGSETLPTIAVLPTGSANVFARALGYPADTFAAAQTLVQIFAANSRRRISLGTWQSDDKPARWFAVNAGFGIDADVIDGVEAVRSRGFSATPLVYLNISLRAWLKIQIIPPGITVEAVDHAGKWFRFTKAPLLFASNTNPWTFLGPLPVVTNPLNSFDSGLGLFGLKNVHGLGGAAAMMSLIGINHPHWLDKTIEKRTIVLDDIAATTFTCGKRQPFQVDGEYEGKPRKVFLESCPNAIEVFAPKETPNTDTHSWAFYLLKYLRDFLRVRI